MYGGRVFRIIHLAPACPPVASQQLHTIVLFYWLFFAEDDKVERAAATLSCKPLFPGAWPGLYQKESRMFEVFAALETGPVLLWCLGLLDEPQDGQTMTSSCVSGGRRSGDGAD